MKSLLPVLSAFVLICACGKSHTKQDNTSNPPLVMSQLDSMIERINTDKGYFTPHWGFTCDVNGRLIKMEGSERDKAGDGYLNPSYSVITFVYNGIDTILSGYSV